MRYLLPSNDVTLASLGVPPYSPPDADWQDEREGSGAPFWSAGDARIGTGPSYDDLVRAIDPTADAALWGGYESAPRYADRDGRAGDAVPFDPRAAALGAFRVPDLPDDASEWAWGERLAGRDGGAEAPAPLASILERRMGLEMLGTEFTPSQRGGYPGVSGGGAGGGSSSSGETPAPPDFSGVPKEHLLSTIWKWIGGVPGGRRAEGAPASAFVGRTGAGSRAERNLAGTPLQTPRGPARNPPGKLIPSGGGKPIRSTAHGIDKVQDRGFVPSVIEQVYRSPNRSPGNRPGTTMHQDPINNIIGVFNDAGELMSTRYGGRKKKVK